MDANQALAKVNLLYARLLGRRAAITEAEDAYEGRQALTFATEEWRQANAARYAGFSDNWCRPIVDAEAERIDVIGFGMEDKNAAKPLWDQWLLNDMEMQSSQGFVTSLTASRSHVFVWGDRNDDSVITWEHPSSVEVEYDWANRRHRTAALKTWSDERYEYATLYEPEAVWKWQRQRLAEVTDRASQAEAARVRGATDGGWVPRENTGDDMWPIWNPLGEVPIVEVPNRPLLARDPISEVAGALSMQRAINLMWAYLFLSADDASMPSRVVLNQGPPMIPVLDKQGNKVGERAINMDELRKRRLLYLKGGNDSKTSIDQWETARLETFTDVIEVAVGHLAAQTRTPPTYLVTKTGMSNVNGQGLKASEIGLVNKVREFQTFATPPIREVFRLIALVKDDPGLAEFARRGAPVWKNPEIRSEAELSDALLKDHQMGYPFEYILEQKGHSPTEIARILAMREDERADPQIAAAMRGLGDAVERGGRALPAAGSDRSDDNVDGAAAVAGDG